MLQYEAATLSATQMKQGVPAEKFTPRQQELSRLDGGLEIDGTQRRKLERTPDEPLGHIVAEEHRAALENRLVRNAYREVPLTGCHNSILPPLPAASFSFPGCPDSRRIRLSPRRGRWRGSAAKPSNSATLEAGG